MDRDDRNQVIPPGKIPPELLKRLLGRVGTPPGDVIVGPGLGEDASVIRLSGGPWVVTSDPVTFATPRPGWYAVMVNANDVAVMGGRPEYFIFTLVMPPGATWGRVESIFGQALDAAGDLGCTLIGGHSEVSDGVAAPIVSLTMFGRLIADRPLSSADGRPGDAVVQVGPLALEGTSILAETRREELEAALGADLVDRAAGFLDHPGLSVVDPAQAAAAELPVGAMHDPTEGGLATGLREIAQASGVGLVVDASRLMVAEETRAVCRVLNVDPLGLISSGCLIFTVPGDRGQAAAELMRSRGWSAAVIGRLTDTAGEYYLDDERGGRPLPEFQADELARLA